MTVRDLQAPSYSDRIGAKWTACNAVVIDGSGEPIYRKRNVMIVQFGAPGDVKQRNGRQFATGGGLGVRHNGRVPFLRRGGSQPVVVRQQCDNLRQ